MADSELRIQPICFKLNFSHLQFKAIKKVGKYLTTPAHIYDYGAAGDSDGKCIGEEYLYCIAHTITDTHMHVFEYKCLIH